MKNSELKIVVISFSDDFTKNSESFIKPLQFSVGLKMRASYNKQQQISAFFKSNKNGK